MKSRMNRSVTDVGIIDHYAYLSSRHTVWIEIGFLVSIGLLLVAFNAPIFNDPGQEVLSIATAEIVQIEEIIQTKQLTKPPPPPRPQVPVVVADDAVFDDDELELDFEFDLDDDIATFISPPPPAFEPDVEEEREIFMVVEEMPEIIGGISELYKYLVYPEMARQAGIEGLVVVQIVIEPDGSPSEPIVARTASALFDQVAMDAVMKLRFIPGQQRGKPVRVQYAIPVRFRLRSDS